MLGEQKLKLEINVGNFSIKGGNTVLSNYSINACKTNGTKIHGSLSSTAVVTEF